MSDELPKKKKPETPTRIRSDIIDIKRKKQLMTFINNVVVEKDDSSLLADKMIVIYKENKNNSQNKTPVAESSAEQGGSTEIERMDAFGHVKIFTKEFIGSGNFGHYQPNLNQFILEENVIINNGTSIASGDKFIYNTLTKKGNFVGKSDQASIGGNKRVMVIIGNDKQEK